MARKKEVEKEIVYNIRDMDIKDEMAKDFIIYAQEVNSNRAFPYLNGLKPIAGHALWAMYANKRTSNRPYTKSAKIEGEVMSYSPHGGCLTADTKMFLLSGEVKTLGELVEANNDEYVLSIDKDGKIIPALATEFRKTKDVNELYEITFANGFTIKATGNHKFRLINGDWISAENLHEGHILDYGKFRNLNDKYLIIHGNNTKSTALHRLVDDYYHKSSLPNGYNVHHEDNNTKNNVPTNLNRLSLMDHMIKHNTGVNTRFGGENSNWNREDAYEKNSKIMSAYNSMQGLFKAKKVLDTLTINNIELTEENYELCRKEDSKLSKSTPKLSTLYNNDNYSQINNFNDLLYMYNNDLIHINYESNKRNVDKLGSNYTFTNKTNEHKSKCKKSLKDNSMVNLLKKSAIRNNFNLDYLKTLKSFAMANKIPTILKVEKIDCSTTPVYDFTVNGPENALISISEDNSLLACAHNSYGSIARMAQDFVYHVPYVDGHGAFGSVIGGPACGASRYTEMRLSEFAEEVLFYNTKLLDMGLNYLEEDPEPKLRTWTSLLPLLFMTNTSGMGYCMSNAWTSGNLLEFSEKLHTYIETGKVDCSNLYPDFPTGGVIINKSDMKELYETGRGTIKLRGKTEIKGDTIRVLSLPYQIYPEKFIEDVKKYISTSANTIKDLRNMCGMKGFLIEIECEKGTAEYTLNCLLKKTCLQTSISDEHKAVGLSGKPELITFEDYMKYFVNSNIELVIKETKLNLEEIENRLEIVSGLLSALDVIDEIIALIKKSKSQEDSRKAISAKFGFTENQAHAICAMTLGRLANLEQIKLKDEKKVLEKNQRELDKILKSKKLQEKKFLNRFDKLVEKYGWERKTEVIDAAVSDVTITNINKPAQIKNKKEYMIVLTSDNRLKRIDVIKFKKTDEDQKNIKVAGTQKVVLISNKGKMYKVFSSKIDLCNSTAAGTLISDIRPEIGDEKIISIYSEDVELPYIYFVTKNGLGKLTEVKNVLKLSKTIGTVVCGLKTEDDEIIAIKLLKPNETIEITTNKRTEIIELDVPLNRYSAGKKIINFKKDEYITEVHSK